MPHYAVNAIHETHIKQPTPNTIHNRRPSTFETKQTYLKCRKGVSRTGWTISVRCKGLGTVCNRLFDIQWSLVSMAINVYVVSNDWDGRVCCDCGFDRALYINSIRTYQTQVRSRKIWKLLLGHWFEAIVWKLRNMAKTPYSLMIKQHGPYQCFNWGFFNEQK